MAAATSQEESATAVSRSMVEAGSFERLAGHREGDHQPDNHFRKGVVGDWRMHLDPSAAQRMVEAVDDLTREIERKFRIDLSSYRTELPAIVA